MATLIDMTVVCTGPFPSTEHTKLIDPCHWFMYMWHIICQEILTLGDVWSTLRLFIQVIMKTFWLQQIDLDVSKDSLFKVL